MPDQRFFQYLGPLTLNEITERVGIPYSSFDSGKKIISDIASFESADNKDICFFSQKENIDESEILSYGACLTTSNLVSLLPESNINLIVDNPLLEFSKIAKLFYKSYDISCESDFNVTNGTSIYNSAEISENVVIEPGCFIGPKVVIGSGSYIQTGVRIGNGVVIGNNCFIGSNSSLQCCVIGNSVRLESGVCIGQEGFGLVFDPTKEIHERIPQLGSVNISNDVSIGSNSTVDRGFLDSTVIGEGCRIDNQVQIGHNVILGKRCILVSQVGISGSCVIGDDVVLGGQVGLADHIKLGQGAKVAAKSGVMKDIQSGETVMGYPAKPIKSFWREIVTVSRLTKSKKSF